MPLLLPWDDAPHSQSTPHVTHMDITLSHLGYGLDTSALLSCSIAEQRSCMAGNPHSDHTIITPTLPVSPKARPVTTVTMSAKLEFGQPEL